MPSFKMKLVGRRRTLPLPIYQDLSKSSSRRRSKGSQYALTALEIHLSPPSKVLRTTSSSNTRVTKSVPDSIVFWSSRIIMLPSCTKFKPRVTATRKHLRSLRNFTSCSDMKFTDQTPLVCLQHPAKFFKVAGECNDYIKQPDGHKPPEPPDSDYHDIHRGQREAGGGFAWLSFRYLLNVDKVNWIISVTDVGQHVHFDMVFNFGMLIVYPFERFPNWEELGEQAIGDLQFGMLILYPFERFPNWEELGEQAIGDLQGNTAVHLLYTHARICSIIRKSGKDIEDLKKTGEVVLDHVDERGLCLHLLQFAEVAGECSDYIKQPDGHKLPEPPDTDFHDIERGQKEAGGGLAWLLFRGFCYYSSEDDQMVIESKAAQGGRLTFIPLAVLSQRLHMFWGYFKHRFAQVTAIDPLPKGLVVPLEVNVGPLGNILEVGFENAQQVILFSPKLSELELETLMKDSLKPQLLPFDIHKGFDSSLQKVSQKLCEAADHVVQNGSQLFVLSDCYEEMVPTWPAIPMLLAVGAVHQHLIRNRLQISVSTVASRYCSVLQYALVCFPDWLLCQVFLQKLKLKGL